MKSITQKIKKYCDRFHFPKNRKTVLNFLFLKENPRMAKIYMYRRGNLLLFKCELVYIIPESAILDKIQVSENFNLPPEEEGLPDDRYYNNCTDFGLTSPYCFVSHLSNKKIVCALYTWSGCCGP